MEILAIFLTKMSSKHMLHLCVAGGRLIDLQGTARRDKSSQGVQSRTTSFALTAGECAGDPVYWPGGFLDTKRI